MRFTVAAACALLLLGGTCTDSQTALMPVDEVRAGMTGTGYTVFKGEAPEPFTVHILGTLHNVVGPRRTMILARLEGGPLATSGVIAGMSGSPVYVDGRLVGAIAYSLGAFPREPIAGITPIAEMIEAARLSTPRSASQRALPTRLDAPDALASAVRALLPGASPFAERLADVRVAVGDVGPYALSLTPIATPVSLAGFSGDARAVLTSVLEQGGFVAVAGGSASPSRAPSGDRALAPGDAVGVSLVSGDLSLAATGTVTHVDGDRVYAFGHPFLNLGPISFPMTRAEVHAVVPSLMSSMKLSSVGAPIGTVRQDRASTIAGTLGAPPPMVPVRITLESQGAPSRRFAFEVANDQVFTPLLAFATVLSVFQSYEREMGSATFAVSGSARVKGLGAVSLENVFAGDAASANAAASVAAPLTSLLRNELADVEIEGIDLVVQSTEQTRTATIERVWLDGGDVRAGRTLVLKIATRSYRGEETVRSLPVPIPEHVRGPLTLLVADASALREWEQHEIRPASDVQNIGQLIRQLNETRRNNRLYVRLASQSAGAVVGGEAMPALPPSVLTVLEAGGTSGSFTPIRSTIVGEWDLPTPDVIKGSRSLRLNVEPR